MDAAYAAGLAALQASGPAERTRLLGSLYTTSLPAVDARLFALDQLHAGDRPAEHADIVRSGRPWATVRALLSPANLPPATAGGRSGSPASAPAASARSVSALAAAYTPVSAHLSRLFQRELVDARTDHAGADAGAVRAIGLIGGTAALGLALGAVFLIHGIRRIRASLEPSSPCPVPTSRSPPRSAWPSSPITPARPTGSSGSPTPPSTWPSGRAGTASSWPIRRPRPPCPPPTAPT